MRRLLRENGLSLVLGALFLLILVGHGVAGHRENNEDRREHGRETIGFAAYLRSGHFLESVFENWESEFFQNWQSEFLAVLAIVVLSIFLREKRSPESKPVAAPHSETGGG
jgi:hypothetical protein